MSYVNDFASTDDENDDEFVADGDQLNAVDDETTQEAEMRLKPEMHPDDEVILLPQRKAEMSVKELKVVITIPNKIKILVTQIQTFETIRTMTRWA